ncbi:TPA: hypothetical protein DEG21_04985 [Patescibacteria group bacterium]|nr:hypothetical protein [Candidatus Gracilibacteria bacterium]HBY75185.1 hypothetical protein [Candidatus Gracilibacteria bacterium]
MSLISRESRMLNSLFDILKDKLFILIVLVNFFNLVKILVFSLFFQEIKILKIILCFFDKVTFLSTSLL